VDSSVLFLHKLTDLVATIGDGQRSRRPSSGDQHHLTFEPLNGYFKGSCSYVRGYVLRTELVVLMWMKLMAL
jgi:hypothetical protein